MQREDENKLAPVANQAIEATRAIDKVSLEEALSKLVECISNLHGKVEVDIGIKAVYTSNDFLWESAVNVSEATKVKIKKWRKIGIMLSLLLSAAIATLGLIYLLSSPSPVISQVPSHVVASMENAGTPKTAFLPPPKKCTSQEVLNALQRRIPGEGVPHERIKQTLGPLAKIIILTDINPGGILFTFTSTTKDLEYVTIEEKKYRWRGDILNIEGRDRGYKDIYEASDAMWLTGWSSLDVVGKTNFSTVLNGLICNKVMIEDYKKMVEAVTTDFIARNYRVKITSEDIDVEIEGTKISNVYNKRTDIRGLPRGPISAYPNHLLFIRTQYMADLSG